MDESRNDDSAGDENGVIANGENDHDESDGPGGAAPLDHTDPSREPAQADEAVKEQSPNRRGRRTTRRIVAGLLLVALGSVAYLYRSKLFGANEGAEVAQSSGERKPLYWQDPMHPAYTSDKPGTAPDCGMDLVPVYAEDTSMPSNMPMGTIQVSSDRQQMIGVTYGVVAFSPVSKTLRAVGRLAYDDRNVVRVHTKVEGWISKVYADFTGKLVAKGQPLVDIYSPDLLQTQQEYLLARKNYDELAQGGYPGVADAALSLVQSSKHRLELWDVTEEQIRALERRGTPSKTITLFAPSSGFVTARNAYERQRITPDTELYAITDLSTIWVIADIYESDAADIHVGQDATVTLSYMPRRPYRGKVSYIYPAVDNASRTLKVRLDVPNPRYELKPDMYANVEFEVTYGRKLVVPNESVLDSGTEQTVFVALEGGYFEPRKVVLGPKVDDKYVVVSGLAEGEKIVTSGNFLIDSESKLKSATGGMGMPGMDMSGSGATGGPENSGQSGEPDGGATPAQPAKPASQGQMPEGMDHSKHKP